jgi:hypothetical protein
MAKQTTKTKEKDAPELAADTVVAMTGGAATGAPTMEPDALMSVTRLEDEARPVMTPPSEAVEQEAEAEGITAWHNGKKITAMWANASVRNAHAAIAGMGWRKLSNANDSSFPALVMLASHAEQTNANCNIRIDADGEIHEIYVW